MGLHNFKPCPFCGGEADKHIDDYGKRRFIVTIRCQKCEAAIFRKGKGAIEAVTEEAVNAWNRRADETKGGFDGTEWERLLLLFLLSFTDPPRREITVRAESGGKTVNITYDPHDAEAVKAAETWRNALFAVKDGDNVNFRERQRRNYLSGAVEKFLQNKQKYVDEAAAAMEPWTPRKPAETVKSDKPAVPEIIANPGNYGVIGFWWEDWADGSCFLRWRTEPGADAMKVVCLTENPDCGFQIETICDGAEDVAGNTRRLYVDDKADAMREVERGIDSRINGGDMRRLTWIRVKKPPKEDTQQLDRAIRDLSGVVKDDQSGLHTYFDGVNMTYILECLKKYREMVGGAL